MSELYKINGNKTLICCFGGMALKMGGIVPFEFLTYLSTIYTNDCDLLFYIDKNQCCYHKGIDGISKNIENTVEYLNQKIHKYDKIIFMGVSAGGYASILFGSLCNNVSNVISFIPKVNLNNPMNKKYKNLKNFINPNTKYILFGDKSITNIQDNHHISQCELLEEFSNVTIFKKENIDLKVLRDTGVIKNVIDDIIYDKSNIISHE
jgi:hypothetical protein